MPAEQAGAVWDAPGQGRRGRRPAAGRAGRPGHAAHRDGLPAARPGPLAGDHAGAGPVGLGGRLEQAGVLGPRGAAGREGGRAAPAAVGPARRSTAASRAPHMAVLRGGRPVGEVTSGTFSPTKRVGIALALLDTAGRARRRATRSRSTSGAGRSAMRVVKPPFVTVVRPLLTVDSPRSATWWRSPGSSRARRPRCGRRRRRSPSSSSSGCWPGGRGCP